MAAPPVLPSSIHDALNFAAPGVIEQMLSNNPQLIHEKGRSTSGHQNGCPLLHYKLKTTLIFTVL